MANAEESLDSLKPVLDAVLSLLDACPALPIGAISATRSFIVAVN